MLTITATIKDSAGEYHSKEYEWYVGNPRPRYYKYDDLDNVTKIRADGTELDYIRARFRNIPMSNILVGNIVWKGDWAQFIYDNLV